MNGMGVSGEIISIQETARIICVGNIFRNTPQSSIVVRATRPDLTFE